jgi:hypothetical protein
LSNSSSERAQKREDGIGLLPAAAVTVRHGEMRRVYIKASLPPQGAPYRISDAASAAAAARLPRGAVVKLAVPCIDPSVAALYESSINASLRECGCRLSAVFLAVAVCAAAVVDVLKWPFICPVPVVAIASEFAVAFIASGIGRIAGVAIARHILRKTLSAVRGRIEGANSRGVESWAV